MLGYTNFQLCPANKHVKAVYKDVLKCTDNIFNLNFNSFDDS